MAKKGYAQTREVKGHNGKNVRFQDLAKKERVNAVSESWRQELSADELKGLERYKEDRDIGLFRIHETQSAANIARIKDNDGPRARVRTENEDITFLVDTGSPINIIDQYTYENMKTKPNIESSEQKFFGFASETPIQMLGKCKTRFQHKKENINAEVMVVKGNHDCLMWYKTAVGLKILTVDKINAVIGEEKELTKEEIHKKFPNLFSGKLGCIREVSVKLGVDETVKPTQQPQRPIAFHLRDTVEKELRNQVLEGILEPVERNSGPTPWISNLVIVPKDKPVISDAGTNSEKTEISVRLTCDSKAVNKEIKRTRFPSKTIEDLVVEVNGATVFSKLDIIKAFHQLKIDKESQYLTVITTHIGLFRYLRLHMGISCASEIFTEVIRKLLEGLPGQLNMTDDILVYGKTGKEHHANLMSVLKCLDNSGVTLNLNKCQFYKREITFFGLRFTKEGISPTEDRCKTLLEVKEPVNAKELRSFLCMVLWSSRFIKNICLISEKLWCLLRKDQPWKWGPEEQKAFDNIKAAISTKCMAYFNKNWDTELEVDAGPTGLGAVLVQYNPENRDDRRMIANASRMLTDVERRYSQCEKEALAAVWGPEKFWVYMFGKKFKMDTDNRAVQLIFANTATKPPARIER